MKSIFVSCLVLAGFFSNWSFADGARDYHSLQEAVQADFYRLTCSDQEATQTHIYVEVSGSRVSDLKMVFVAPARSLNTVEYSAADRAKLAVTYHAGALRIEGARPGVLLDEDLALIVRDSPKKGIVATLTYDDHDGTYFVRRLKCGAVNYILSP